MVKTSYDKGTRTSILEQTVDKMDIREDLLLRDDVPLYFGTDQDAENLFDSATGVVRKSGANRRLDDDLQMQLGTDNDFRIRYDSADDRLYIEGPWGFRLWGEGADGAMWLDSAAAVNLNTILRLRGNRLKGSQPFDLDKAYDSAPSHYNGRIVLASPAWDPDGDGNGEIVCSDGTAWNEVVDLPNYT